MSFHRLWIASTSTLSSTRRSKSSAVAPKSAIASCNLRACRPSTMHPSLRTTGSGLACTACRVQRPAFIDSTRASGARALPCASRASYHLVMAADDHDDDGDAHQLAISSMVVRSLPQGTRFALAGWHHSLPRIIDRMDAPPLQSYEQPQRQAVFRLNDKMSIFISVCSLLLSLQLIQPRLML